MKYLIIYKYSTNKDVATTPESFIKVYEGSSILDLTEEHINENYIISRINIDKSIKISYIVNIVKII